MNDLLNKLNVLVKATLNDALTGDSRRNKLVTPNNGDKSSAVQAGKQQITQLRQRINETLAFEDELLKQIQSLQAEVANWDEQADAAVTDGDDAKAHYAVEQMQRVQERLAIAQSDLAAHERVTQELIYHVNTLEAAVDAAAQKQVDEPAATETANDKVSGVLGEMRDKILEMRDQIASRGESMPEAVETPSEQPVEDDLAKRRQRLSKPE